MKIYSDLTKSQKRFVDIAIKHYGSFEDSLIKLKQVNFIVENYKIGFPNWLRINNTHGRGVFVLPIPSENYSDEPEIIEVCDKQKISSTKLNYNSDVLEIVENYIPNYNPTEDFNSLCVEYNINQN